MFSVFTSCITLPEAKLLQLLKLYFSYRFQIKPAHTLTNQASVYYKNQEGLLSFHVKDFQILEIFVP